MDYDVVVVGAGPAGLAAACRLKQLNSDISVCVVEKGSEVGAHILSGAVFEPTALSELFPDWESMGAPLKTPVSDDHIFVFTGAEKRIKVPGLFAPKTMHNKGNYIISLGNLCRWLAEQAENLGVEVFPGFAAAEVLYGECGEVKGIITGDMGISHSGEQKDSYMQGMELRAKYTLFSEGCRGHLGKELIAKFQLDKDKDPQHYGIGIKELWKVPDSQHKPGLVVHSAGWPLDTGWPLDKMKNSSGGGFLYHLEDNQIAVGLIVNLSYTNPHVSPYDEFQRYKHHPEIKQYLEGGERLTYGARALLKGGLQSQPKMSFPGGLLIGDDAGTLNFAKIKGSHTAMKSGMIAAETVADALASDTSHTDLETYGEAYKKSWAYKELHMQRNFGPAQHKFGSILGSAYAFIDINLFNGLLPWTMRDKVADHETLKPADQCPQIDYPKYDGKLSFDKASSVFLSNTNHEEDQPCHLVLKDPELPIASNLPLYDEPAQRYCPAGVYEVVANDDGIQRFQINAQNCVHCKTCDIKEPSQNINWVVPEGAGGPNYPNM
ncbi:MAG: electron transfer flavoprotein-ubiquinone oxidoreductase [Porticoccaceae bacterium]